jgi:phosphoglycolate phosphatase
MDIDVYFDLDGTLTDPWEGISRSICHALDHFDVPHPDEAALRELIGPPLRASLAGYVGEDRADRALDVYRERFAESGWHENRRYPGIRTMLAELAASGARLYVATSKPRVFAEPIVEHFGLADYFRAVFGAELDGTRGDKTELLAHALRQNPPAGRAVMIGDRRHDMMGATNNNMFAVGVAWGYGSIDELEAAGARRIARTPAELPGLIATS